MNWTVLYALLSKKISEMEGVHNEVVEELPSTGQENVCYFVPKDEPGTNDIYDEYIWTDSDGYEKIGSTQIDLTGYLKSEDVAAVALSGDYDDLDNKPDLSGYLTSSDVANVAISGAYSDLSGAPTLASVATSGDYNDLENKPTIPDPVSISETLTPDIYKKKIAKLTIGSSDTEVYSDDAEKIVKKIFGEDTILEGNPISFDAFTGIETAKACSVDLLPIQDLHGYDSPWVGGAGKNKLGTSLSNIKTANTSGTWTNNSYERNGITFTVNDDGTIKAVGTATSNAYLILPYEYSISAGTYTLSGCPSGGSQTKYEIYFDADRSGTREQGTGKVLTLSAGYDLKLVIFVANGQSNVNLLFEPQLESGSTKTDFAPYSNICPISGRTQTSVTRTGKNLCNPANISVFNSNRYFCTTNYSTTPMIPVKASTQYALSCRKGTPSNNQDFKIYYWDSNNTAISNEKANPFTTPSNCAKISFYCGYSDGDFTDGDDVKAQVEEGSTATTYEAYQGSTVTIQFGQTVYGGTLDVTNGKLTIDKEYRLFNGTENWQVNGTGTDHYFYYINLGSADYAVQGDIISDKFTTASVSQYNTTVGTIFCTPQYIRVRPFSTELSVSDWKTWLQSNNVQVVFGIQTPIELTLTPEEISLLKGNNVVSTDGNNIKIAISADIKAAIDKAIQESITDVLEEEY